MEIRVVLLKERCTKYSCISPNISVCNIYSTGANVDGDGYRKECKKVEKCPSKAYKDNPVILNVKKIEPKSMLQKDVFQIKCIDDKLPEIRPIKKAGQSNPKLYHTLKSSASNMNCSCINC